MATHLRLMQLGNIGIGNIAHQDSAKFIAKRWGTGTGAMPRERLLQRNSTDL